MIKYSQFWKLMLKCNKIEIDTVRKCIKTTSTSSVHVYVKQSSTSWLDFIRLHGMYIYEEQAWLKCECQFWQEFGGSGKYRDSNRVWYTFFYFFLIEWNITI